MRRGTAVRTLELLLACGLSLAAQPTRPEVFGYAGALRAAGDEGSLGNGVLWGGDAIVPITRRFAFGADVGTARTERKLGSDDFRLCRTFLGFTLLARWGTERTYFFAGGGAGLEHSSSASTASNILPGIRPPGAEEIAPGVFRFRSSDTKPGLVGRAGVVQALSRGMLLRFDFLWSQQFVLPSIGVRGGFGYRF